MKTLASILLFTSCSWAGSYTAATCNRSDVNAVINGPTHTAVDGDVINIPSGTCTWTTGIVVPNHIGISIIGAGSSSTTIIDDYVTSASWLFFFTPTFGNSLSRISGMTLSPNTGLSINSISAPIAFQGTCASGGCPNIRVDNLVFPASPSWASLTEPSSTLVVTDNVFGVLDHNTLNLNSTGGEFYEFVNFNNSAWQGVGQYGDNSWASADTFGTSQALYVETNTFNLTGAGANLFPITETEGGFSLTSEGGGRVVCRFNTATGLRSMCVNHGTESNGRPRGGRQMEFYDNTMSCPSNAYPGCFNNDMLQGSGPRSGSLLNIANSFTWGAGTGIDQFTSITEYRALQNVSAPWGACDGTGQWDDNDPTTYFTGTIASVTGSNPYTITVSGSPGWTTNQWVNNGSPYSIHDSTINNGSEITASTSNTLSVTAWTSIPFTNGDSITIQRAFQCLDQSSRIGGSLLSGSTPTPTNTSGGWANQSLDPVYEAADTASGTPVFGAITSNTARIISNRDYYAEVSQTAQTSATSPFNGTVGTGYGTLARRPTTCTTGVGYWATDQGTWNQSGGGGQGELFTCVSTNTWALSYTPYTYPHPLIGGGGGNSGTGGSGVSQVCAGFLPYPCARQDLALQQESPLPMTINSDGAGLNFPAGSCYVDPDFGETICRVSDNNSLNGAGCFNSGTQNTILKLADNPDISSFSSDDQWFNITDTNANWWLYKFNPSTLGITCEPTTSANHTLPWHPAWLHHTAGQMIGEIAASSLTPWILQTANVSTLPGLTTSTLVDFSSTSQCGVGGNATFLSSIPQPNKSMGSYIEGPWISNDDSTYEMSVGPSQNQGWLSLLYNKTLGECAWIDTRTGQVGGNLTTTGTLSGAFPLDWGSPRAPFVPTVTQATNGSGTLTSGHTYDVCYSLVEMTREEGTGESSCSTVQRVAITGGNNALSIPSPVQCSQNGTSLSANCDIEMWNYYNVYANDEANCSNAQCPASSLFLQPAGNLGCALGTPGANGFGSGSIVPHTAGSTNFAYAEIAFNANCVTFTQASISNAASTLDSSHYNVVTPVTVSGATLYMMVSGGIGNSSVWPSTRYGSASVDAANSTGGGSILFPGQINDSTTPPATITDNGGLGINLFALGTIPACPGNPPSSGLLAGQCAVQSTPSSGTVNTSGTSVTWVSGSHFATTWLGGLYINNVMYTISSCSSTTACTLTTSAGTQTGATYFFGIYYISNPVTMTALTTSGSPTAPTASTLGLYQHAAIMDRSGASISWGQEPVFGSNVLWRTGTLIDTLINVNKNNEYPTIGAYLNGVGHGLMGQTHETFDVGPSNPLGSNPGGDPNFSSICVNLDSSFPVNSSALWFSPNCGSLSSITFPALDPAGSDSYDNHSTWASSAGLGTSDTNTNYQQSWDVGGGASGNTFQYPTYIGRAWARELIDLTNTGTVYRYLHHRASGYLFYTLSPCVNLGGNCFNNAGLNYDTYATESQDGKYAVWLSDLTSGLGCDPTEVFVVTGFTAPNQITISANDSNSAKAPLTNQVGTVLDTTGVTGLNAQWTASSVTGSNPYTVTLTGASLSGTVSGGTWQNCTFDTSGRVNGPVAASTCGSGTQACQTGASRTDIWLGVKK